LVEIRDSERSSYEQQQQNYSDTNDGETEKNTLNHDIVSPPEGIVCQYCDLKKCPCCLFDVNYYYNFGLSRRKIRLCTACYNEIYGNGRKISSEIVTKAYMRIYETVISATVTINPRNCQRVNYFDAVKCAFDMNPEVRAYLGESCNIDKNLKGLWSLTYAIINERERGIEVLNADPDNLILGLDYNKICLPHSDNLKFG
jgi:hypothetical protein